MEDKITILYADDEPINLMLFEEIFSESFNIISAESGSQGIMLLQSKPEIEVVISDLKMPGMNGIDFINLAKKEFPKVKYFILTGYGITEEIAKALNSKLIINYFRKPLNVKEIVDAITMALKQ